MSDTQTSSTENNAAIRLAIRQNIFCNSAPCSNENKYRAAPIPVPTIFLHNAVPARKENRRRANLPLSLACTNPILPNTYKIVRRIRRFVHTQRAAQTSLRPQANPRLAFDHRAYPAYKRVPEHRSVETTFAAGEIQRTP